MFVHPLTFPTPRAVELLSHDKLGGKSSILLEISHPQPKLLNIQAKNLKQEKKP